MEHRLKYRDIPWLVALGVLPGKIIGTFLIKPFLKLTFNDGYLAKVWLTRLLVVSLVFVVGGLFLALVDYATDGAVTASLSQTWGWWLAAAQTANETVPTPTEIGLR